VFGTWLVSIMVISCPLRGFTMWSGNDRQPALIPFFKAIKHTFPHCSITINFRGSAHSRGTPEFWLSLIYLDARIPAAPEVISTLPTDIKLLSFPAILCQMPFYLRSLAMCVYNFPQITSLRAGHRHTHVYGCDFDWLTKIFVGLLSLVLRDYRTGKGNLKLSALAQWALCGHCFVCVSSSVCH